MTLLEEYAEWLYVRYGLADEETVRRQEQVFFGEEDFLDDFEVAEVFTLVAQIWEDRVDV